MGDDSSSPATPARAVTVERKPGAQLALALTVFALVLASNSIINDSWLTQTQDAGNVEIIADYSLTEISVENTATGESEVSGYDSLYDDCKDIGGGGDEDSCANVKDFHDAGFVAIIMLIIGSIILLAATVMQVRSMMGMGQRKSNLVSAIAGIWVGISVLVWSLMLPDSDVGPEWSQGVWMALIAAAAGLVAGFSGVIQSWIDGPPRMRATGVRSGSGMKEFVLKESSCGDRCLSILVDSELIRVAKVERVGSTASTKDILATRRDSYTGFSHQRLDWLDDFKGLWWVISGATLICSFMISILFLIPFTITATLALLQLMDPERFVVSTNSGNHPFYINRWRSNRELTNLAMDLVDEAMIAVLRGEELDTNSLDAQADLIAERFSANRDAKREAEQAAAAEKEAFIAATNTAPAPPSVVMPTTEIPPPPAPMPVAQESQQVVTSELPHEAPEPQIEAPVAAPVAEPVAEPTPLVEAPQAPPEPAPEPIIETPPAPTPVVAIPPPPPLPAVIPVPAVALPPPPPALPLPPVVMPPPPGIAGIPAPPPPMGAAIMPPLTTQQSIPAPPVIVQAGPREENLSDDEKDNLLGDLSS